MRRRLLNISILFCSVVLLWGISPKSVKQQAKSPKATDIEVVDNQVKFFVEKRATSSRYSMGISFENWKEGDVILVNGASCPVQTDADGKFYITAKANTDKIYKAVFLGHSIYQSADGIKGMWIPFSQFWETTINNFKDYPMYALLPGSSRVQPGVRSPSHRHKTSPRIPADCRSSLPRCRQRYMQLPPLDDFPWNEYATV